MYQVRGGSCDHRGLHQVPLQLHLCLSNLIARSQHGESHPWQRSWWRGLIGKGEIRPRGNPHGPSWASTPKPESVCFIILWLSPTFLTLTGSIPDHLSLEKVNLEFQLTVSCVYKECFSSNPSDGSLTCLTPDLYNNECDCLQPPTCEKHKT